MIAMDNSALIDPTTGIGMPPENIALLVPGATFAYNSGAKTMTVTGAATLTAPDTFKNANVQVSDAQGGTVKGSFATATGNTGALDISGLDLTTSLTVKCFMVTNKGVQATGEATYINVTNNAGSLGAWQINSNGAF